MISGVVGAAAQQNQYQYALHRWWNGEHWSSAGFIWLAFLLLPLVAVLVASLLERREAARGSPPTLSPRARSAEVSRSSPAESRPAPPLAQSSSPRLPVVRPIRASDTERDAAVGIVADAMALGRLTLEEGRERIGAACAATHRHELAELTGDLPRVGTVGWPPARWSRSGTLTMLAFGLGVLGGLGVGFLAWGAAANTWLLLPLGVLVLFLLVFARRLVIAHHRRLGSARSRHPL